MGIFVVMSVLKTHFTQQFNGIVWRMEIDAATDTLAVEIRQDTDKQVSFAAIDLTSGKLNFTGLTTSERWLTGLEGTHNGVILLHHYQSATSPVHKGLIAADAGTGHVLWSNYNYAFSNFCSGGVVLYDTRLQPHKFFLADLKTGATLRDYQPSIDITLQSEITLPDMVAPEGYLPQQPFGNIIHQLFFKHYRIVSLHALTGREELTQQLYIIDGTTISYHDLLNAAIQKLQPEAFVLYKDHLIYLKNRSQLKVINL